jgi:hypothetical protein
LAPGAKPTDGDETSPSTGKSDTEIRLLNPRPKRDLAGLAAFDESPFGSALVSTFDMKGLLPAIW